MKHSMTPSGIEPSTFRFVAEHLNNCATAVLSTKTISWGKRQPVRKTDNLLPSCALLRNLGTLNSWNPLDLSGPVMGLIFTNYSTLQPSVRAGIFEWRELSLVPHTVRSHNYDVCGILLTPALTTCSSTHFYRAFK